MKKIILVVILLLLNGCTISYNLDINKDLSVNEKIIVIEDDYLFDTTIIPDYDKIKNNYKINVDDSSEYISATYTRKYDNILDIEKEELFNNYYGNVIVNSKSITTFRVVATDKLQKYITSTEFEEAMVKRIKVIITVPFKVKKHNADEVDGNKYSWSINEKNYLEAMNIEFDTSIVNAKNNTMTGLIILLSLVAVGVFIAYKVKNLMQF